MTPEGMLTEMVIFFFLLYSRDDLYQSLPNETPLMAQSATMQLHHGRLSRREKRYTKQYTLTDVIIFPMLVCLIKSVSYTVTSYPS